MRPPPTIVATLAAAGVLGAGAAGAFDLPAWLHRDAAKPAAPATQVAAAESVPIQPTQALVPDYRAIVKRYGPAVVGVTVAGLRQVSADERGLPPDIENDPFFQFFRGMPELGRRGRGRGAPQGVPFRGQGSGFIVAADGLILTNAHVVRDAKEVTVQLADRREFAAKVLGADAVTDVAVLRIDAHDLPTVRLGDAHNVEVGDRVLAIGAPYGLEQTATQGIVSAKGRSLPGDAVVPFLQTDAAVNPGNSGGPLFDSRGEVVGINAQIYSESGGFQGLSFAIPIDVALEVKDQIVATGHASHARLGVAVQDLTQPLADSFGLPRPDGALVSQVTPGSAAAAAGLEPGDVITQVNGETVERSGALSSLIGLARPGERVKLKVWRDHAWRDIDAKLGNAEAVAQTDRAATGADGGGKLGLSLRPLSLQERRQANVEQGLLVQDVAGAAARAGVEPGDVLLAANGRPLQSVDQLRELLRSKPKTIALLVQRGADERIFVPVKLG
jgi:serine protease Do